MDLLMFPQKISTSLFLPSLRQGALALAMLIGSTAAVANDFLLDPAYANFRQKMIDQHQFTGLQIDEAMSSAQRIDRILSIMS
ncbi:hypothetical protein JBF12_48610, partial [Streptomyces javensis]|nr:hypothetical protein [Streptomyces javensis]